MRTYKTPLALREAMLAYLRSQREQWIAENGPCARCGFWGELEVDHIDPDQKVSHNVWSWSAERREAELKKCQVLCRLCHSIKSAKERRDRAGKMEAGPQLDPRVRAALARYVA